MLYDKLNYSKIGNGKNVIVFLHGWGCNASTFGSVAHDLQDCTCYLIDLYGFGSTPITRVMDTYEYAMQLYLFFVALKLNNIVLVCHSFGGRLGVLLSTIFDVKISKLILIDSAGLKSKLNIFTKLKILEYKLVKYLVKIKCIKPNVLQKFGSKDLQGAKSCLKISFVKVVNQHLNYLIPKINIPTLVVWGTLDKDTPMYMAQVFIKKIPNARAVFYKSGHFSYVNNTDFVYRLDSFVKE